MSIFFGRIVSEGSMYKSERRGSCHQKLPLHPRIADKPRDDLSILLHQRRTSETSGARAHHPRPSPRGTVLGLLPRRGGRGRSRSYGRRLRGGPFPSNPTGRRRDGADRSLHGRCGLYIVTNEAAILSRYLEKVDKCFPIVRHTLRRT